MTGKELGVVQLQPDETGGAISPDGQHIAFVTADRTGNRIRVANLQGSTRRLISVASVQPLRNLLWDAAGTGFFASDLQTTTALTRLLRIDNDGAVHVLLEQRAVGDPYAIPSPDGRHLATFKSTNNSNVWMVERR